MHELKEEFSLINHALVHIRLGQAEILAKMENPLSIEDAKALEGTLKRLRRVSRSLKKLDDKTPIHLIT